MFNVNFSLALLLAQFHTHLMVFSKFFCFFQGQNLSCWCCALCMTPLTALGTLLLLEELSSHLEKLFPHIAGICVRQKQKCIAGAEREQQHKEWGNHSVICIWCWGVGDDSITFLGRGPRGQGQLCKQVRNTQLYDRIRVLENSFHT